MLTLNKILLASHGTPGAIAAESFILQHCHGGEQLHHLTVVPELWKDMMGDDWLNNACTRKTYGDYVENELIREISVHVNQVQTQMQAKDIHYSHEIILGEPSQCLINASMQTHYDVIIIGSARSKGESGLRSKIALDKTAKSLTTPMIIVPRQSHPELT